MVFKLVCYDLLSYLFAILAVTLCGTIVNIVDTEKHLGNKLFDNIYKRHMKVLIGVFYRHSNAIIANFDICDSQT